jgi:hypothetical protein
MASDPSFRVPVPDFRLRSVVTPRWSAGLGGEHEAPRRYGFHVRKLTPAQEAETRALAGTKGLRALAADFGVSHETVRAALRTRVVR